MRHITIGLPDELYAELTEVASRINEHGYGPQAWAEDALASALASRRLPSIPMGRCGARLSTVGVEEVGEIGPEGCRVLWPEAESLT